jgi:PQQ-dependent catabolism-associated CXXCW motif protein
MPRSFAFALFVWLAAGPLSSLFAQGKGDPPPEPPGYRLDHYRAPTPASLAGARTIHTAEAYDLWRRGAALFIDAMPRPPKPANLPAGTIWRDKPRFNIPGSAWLVDIGYGELSPERDLYFRDHLARLTKGDKNRPLVFYCKADCWMSWNAAKRAISGYGYGRVIWYPDGTDGWVQAGHKLEEDQPEK